VVIASVVGMFWQSEGLQFILSFCGVIVFTGLAAYDAQKLKAMALAIPGADRHRRPAPAATRSSGRSRCISNFINLFPDAPASARRSPALTTAGLRACSHEDTRRTYVGAGERANIRSCPPVCNEQTSGGERAMRQSCFCKQLLH
jgi:hypothetical protein